MNEEVMSTLRHSMLLRRPVLWIIFRSINGWWNDVFFV